MGSLNQFLPGRLRPPFASVDEWRWVATVALVDAEHHLVEAWQPDSPLCVWTGSPRLARRLPELPACGPLVCPWLPLFAEPHGAASAEAAAAAAVGAAAAASAGPVRADDSDGR